jgi:hypothetical protein
VESKLGPRGTSPTNCLIAPAPGDCEDREFGGMKIGRGNRNTWRKPDPPPLCPPQIPLDHTRALTGAAAVGLTACSGYSVAAMRTRTVVKLSLCLTNSALRHEGVWGSGCINPNFLDLGTSWRWVVSFTPLPLYPRGKSPRYPLDRRLGGPQSRSERFGEEKILDLTGARTPTPQSSSP